MKSNNDRSKTINHKTTKTVTKNYHPRAEDPLLLVIFLPNKTKRRTMIMMLITKVTKPR